MAASYAWTIDRVNVKELGDDMGDEVGTYGPRDASDALLDELKRGKGYTFRMLDDDGLWYYRGRIVFDPAVDEGPPQLSSYSEPERRYYIVGGGLAWGDEVACFGPLNDFGTPNAGAVTLQYRTDDPSTIDGGKPAKVWAVL